MTDAHTIPDHIAARAARLINEIENVRQQANDDLKQAYADLREELKGMGWAGSTVSSEVAALKGAIAEMRLDDQKKLARDDKVERIDDYISMLSRARARDGASGSSKGRTADFGSADGGSNPSPETSSDRHHDDVAANAPAESASEEISALNPHRVMSSSPADDATAAGASSRAPAANHSMPDVPEFLRRQA